MKIKSTKANCPRSSIFEVSADSLASQVTITDLQIFKSIRRNELVNLGAACGLTQSNKRNNLAKRLLVPNVMAMNRQFNQTSYWVVREILRHNSSRLRAQWICLFIETAKKLHELNNLHSAYAFVSAMLSTSIYRLNKTWHQVRKRHLKVKLQFDELCAFYSDESNYCQLRKHLLACPLPCIPYLGIYSRDIIYLNEAYPEASEQRINAVGRIIDALERFQQSTYDHLNSSQELEQCFKSSRYIDDMQKFVEDESYRRSLKLEPSERCSFDKCSNSVQKSLSDRQSSDLTKNVDNMNKPTKHLLSKEVVVDQNGNNLAQNYAKTHHRNSALLLVWSLTSIFQSAILSTSNKFNSSQSVDSIDTSRASKQPRNIYLVDDNDDGYAREHPIAAIASDHQAAIEGDNRQH